MFFGINDVTWLLKSKKLCCKMLCHLLNLWKSLLSLVITSSRRGDMWLTPHQHPVIAKHHMCNNSSKPKSCWLREHGFEGFFTWFTCSSWLSHRVHIRQLKTHTHTHTHTHTRTHTHTDRSCHSLIDNNLPIRPWGTTVPLFLCFNFSCIDCELKNPKLKTEGGICY